MMIVSIGTYNLVSLTRVRNINFVTGIIIQRPKELNRNERIHQNFLVAILLR